MSFALIWSRFSKWIIAALAASAGIAAFYLKGLSAGKAKEQKKATERDLTEARHHAETIRETANVEAEVSRLPDSALDERLRKWTRD